MIITISVKNSAYPKILSEIYDPPSHIYIRGDKAILNKPAIAVVGTRRATEYGIQATKEIVKELVKTHFVIISGLALGIDTIAHQAALDNNGETIAVLGSSIDDSSIYPKENLKLAHRIIESGGAVITEYPAPTPAQKHTFPQRNRIISGLSEAVIVIEAPLKSGALITAKFALEQNREVFALPGSVFSENSFGTNFLIKQGAHPIISFQEIIEELGYQKKIRI